jgi:hypothetical protein
VRATLDDFEAAPPEHLVLADVHTLTRQTNVLCAHLAELAAHSARVANLVPVATTSAATATPPGGSSRESRANSRLQQQQAAAATPPAAGGGSAYYPQCSQQHDEALLRAVRERCEGSLRWLENYAHRAHNLLTIISSGAAGSAARRRGSAVTVTGRRWSGSLAPSLPPQNGDGGAHWREGTGAEGMVVVVFLPATFVCVSWGGGGG